MSNLREVECTKQAEQYFLSYKDVWSDSDFPNLLPLDSSFTMRFILPYQMRLNGQLRTYPLGGTPVLGIFTAMEVSNNQPINDPVLPDLISPVDGWYVQGKIAIHNITFMTYYFCNHEGIIHNKWPDKSKTGMLLRLNPNDGVSNDPGFRDAATMFVHIFCLAISQEKNKVSSNNKRTDEQPWSRPKQVLRDIGRNWPEAWHDVKRMRADRGKNLPDWPDWCYIPIAAGIAIGGSNFFDKQLSPVAITAAAAWRVSQGVYRFDTDLYDELVHQPLDGNLPCEVLTKLPEWCVYVETVNARFQGKPIIGFWAHLESDANDGRMELRFVLFTADGQNIPFPIHLGDWTLEEGLDRMQSEANKCSGFNLPMLTDSLREEILPLLQLVLYLCAENMDLQTQPVHPLKRATASGRIDAPKEPHMWIVGQRIGAAIRTYRNKQTFSDTDKQAGGTHASPRPHMRRAHWHHFWKGPLDSEREIILRWLSPIPIAVTDEDELIVNMKIVKTDKDEQKA